MPYKSYLLERFKIKQVSLFNIKEFYLILFRWFETMGYSFYEKEYLDQEKPEGKQVELRWFADKKMDTYTRFVIEMGFLITGLKKAEIERGGVKTSANKGSLEMRITAYVERDYDGKWSKTPLMKQMRRFYDKYIVRERHDKLEAEIMGEAHQLIDEIRAFLGMHKFEPI